MHGCVSLNSSIGMTKSALEAMNGINLFGDHGSSLSIIHVDPDAQYRNCVILNNLLPRESTSKEADASLLCITGYPAFAIDDAVLCKKTEMKVKELLGVRVMHVHNRVLWGRGEGCEWMSYTELDPPPITILRHTPSYFINI